MVDPESIHEGMVVRCADGERLGTIIGLGETHFQVEKGLLGRQREFLVDFSDVVSVAGNHILISRTLEEVENLMEDDGGSVGPRGSETHIDSEPNNLGY